MEAAARAALNGWMVRLADGDRAVADDVLRAVSPPVRALCARMLGASTEVDDVAQEVLVDLFRRASDFDREGDALAWALTIATWHCRTERRRRARSHARAGSLETEPSAEADFEGALDTRRAWRVLEEAAGSFTDKDRETLGAILAGDSLDAALRKRKERILVRLRRLFLGDAR